MPDIVDTVKWAPDDGLRYHPKHVEQFADINKMYIIASCWIIIDTYYAMYGPMNIKLKIPIYPNSHKIDFEKNISIFSHWGSSSTE